MRIRFSGGDFKSINLGVATYLIVNYDHLTLTSSKLIMKFEFLVVFRVHSVSLALFAAGSFDSSI